MKRLYLLLMFAGFGWVVPAAAQDTRQVSEPVTPPVCTVLTANLALASASDDDTQRLQQALTHCPVGHAVELAAHNEKTSFVSGPLRLPSGVSLLIDRDVTLYASVNPALYDKGKGMCGNNGSERGGCKPFISVSDADNVGIYGEGVIDGQGGQTVLGKTESWWQMARRAQAEKNEHNVPRLIEMTRARNLVLHNIRLHNSPNFHVTLNRVDGFTAWGVKIDTPTHARNTDGIDPISSRNITIAHSFIRTGDDNIAIKAGNNGATEHISILHNHFYSGHGMSIGSETNSGVRHVLVDDLSMDGTTSGLRIKSDVSRGGVVQHVRYHDVCLRNTKTALDFDTRYGRDAKGNLLPVYRDIALDKVWSQAQMRVVMRGVDADHPLQLRLRDVVVAGPVKMTTQFAQVAWWHSDGERTQAIGEASQDLPFVVNGDAPLDPAFAQRQAHCEKKWLAFPEWQKRALRPQLSAEQAANYSIGEVLKHKGSAGQELADPWSPMEDRLVTQAQTLGQFAFDYVVDAQTKEDGIRHFKTVQAAVNRAVIDAQTVSGKSRLWIAVQPGRYQELVYIPKTSVAISVVGQGSDANQTRISANVHAALLGSVYAQRFAAQFSGLDAGIQAMFDQVKSKAVVGTFGTPVLWVKSDGFQLKNIRVENTYNKESAQAGEECPNTRCGAAASATASATAPAVVVHHQAIALMVDVADKAQFEQVRVHGLQDTLFLRAEKIAQITRSFFHRSYVEGDVDFIFGDSTAYFYRSEIKSIGDRSTSYVVAPNTNLRNRYGFVFNEVQFTHDGSANALAGKFYLGRQWFHSQKCTPYAVINLPDYACKLAAQDGYQAPKGSISRQVLETVGKAVILNSVIGAHIQKQHPWADWNKKGSLAFRPAQFSANDYWRNLREAGIDLTSNDDQSQAGSVAQVFLAEFNNREQ